MHQVIDICFETTRHHHIFPWTFYVCLLRHPKDITSDNSPRQIFVAVIDAEPSSRCGFVKNVCINTWNRVRQDQTVLVKYDVQVFV